MTKIIGLKLKQREGSVNYESQDLLKAMQLHYFQYYDQPIKSKDIFT